MQKKTKQKVNYKNNVAHKKSKARYTHDCLRAHARVGFSLIQTLKPSARWISNGKTKTQKRKIFTNLDFDPIYCAHRVLVSWRCGRVSAAKNMETTEIEYHEFSYIVGLFMANCMVKYNWRMMDILANRFCCNAQIFVVLLWPEYIVGMETVSHAWNIFFNLCGILCIKYFCIRVVKLNFGSLAKKRILFSSGAIHIKTRRM